MHRSFFKRNTSKPLAYYLPIVVFLLSALVSTGVTMYVTGYMLDSDASSEMVLAQHLAQTRQLLSRDWVYGNELRVLQVQWVFTPLMLFLDNWHLVRFLGTMILQAVYILSFIYMTRQAGFRQETVWYGAALLLLPVSVTYGRIILYHAHYIVNITISFLMYGMVIDLYQTWNSRRLRSWLLVGGLMVVSFLGGANGIRQLMITHMPMLFSIIALCLRQDTPSSPSAALLSKPALRLLRFALLAAACSFAALLFNQLVLRESYTSSPYFSDKVNLIDFSLMDDVAFGYLHQFGYRKGVPLVSLFGILSAGSLIAGGYAIYASAKALLQSPHLNTHSLILFGLCSFTTVMTVVFLVNADEGYYFPLYLSIAWSWAVIPLVESWGNNPGKYSFLHRSRIFATTAALVILLSGWLNIAWFTGNLSAEQHYEGLVYQNRDTVSQLYHTASFLKKNDYHIGYATYWNANVVTEVTDGTVRMVPLSQSSDPEGSLQYYSILTSRQLRELPNEKPFLLITSSEELPVEMTPYCVQVYADDCYCVYDITDLAAFQERLRY